LGVGARLARRIEALGLTTPLPIQAATIPDALAGRDICGQAPTGSGKTLAFGVPLVSMTSGAAPRRPRALVLVPTRELAEQVSRVLADLMDGGSKRVVALYGGTGYGPQRQALRRGVDIVVACPGRLEDLLAQGDLDLSDVRAVVLDEADRMVDMGFVRPVCRLVDQTAEGRQVLLFSATMGKEVNAISRRYQRDPTRCNVLPEPSQAAEVTHHFWHTPRVERVNVTAQLIAQHGQAFVFCRTKRGADKVAKQLRAAGVQAAPIHGDRSQSQRAHALASFASRRTSALVATDVVARGIHVDDVPCVVHFDPATDVDCYVHRSGRTGRVGSQGTVVSLVPDEMRNDVRALQRSLGFAHSLTAPFADGGSSRHKPKALPAPQATPAPRGRQALRVSGTVKFFDPKRGYGFLSVPNGSKVFVHHSKVQGRSGDRRTLQKGDLVDFDLAEGARGQEAHNVSVARELAS
jgi:superfamily II DNA/RNA helicase